RRHAPKNGREYSVIRLLYTKRRIVAHEHAPAGYPGNAGGVDKDTRGSSPLGIRQHRGNGGITALRAIFDDFDAVSEYLPELVIYGGRCQQGVRLSLRSILTIVGVVPKSVLSTDDFRRVESSAAKHVYVSS